MTNIYNVFTYGISDPIGGTHEDSWQNHLGRSNGLRGGVDMGYPCGTDVKSPVAGTVKWWGAQGAAGNVMSIGMDDGRAVVFEHLESAAVDDGLVYAGQVVAKSGNTGGDYGCHLHVHVISNAASLESTRSDIFNQFTAGNPPDPTTIDEETMYLLKNTQTNSRYVIAPFYIRHAPTSAHGDLWESGKFPILSGDTATCTRWLAAFGVSGFPAGDDPVYTGNRVNPEPVVVSGGTAGNRGTGMFIAWDTSGAAYLFTPNGKVLLQSMDEYGLIFRLLNSDQSINSSQSSAKSDTFTPGQIEWINNILRKAVPTRFELIRQAGELETWLSVDRVHRYKIPDMTALGVYQTFVTAAGQSAAVVDVPNKAHYGSPVTANGAPLG